MRTRAESNDFPSPPANVPADFAKPSAQYRRRAWVSMLGLIAFGLFYLALTAWFGWSAYRLLTTPPGTNGQGGALIQGIGSLVLAVFLVKGMFFRKHSPQPRGFEVTAKDEPLLFEFLYRIADETKAPRPHKVFLSPDVNACVFYDLSLKNFIVPTRKNLEIGLGLVNVLSLSEFKAVLAHEFGHFAQSTMAVGRWVYMAQQVAMHLIYHRDALDKFLNFVSRIDIRVAWIGWGLRLVVWAIRSILDTALSGVLIAHHALSREMEFQADLVSVSTTGSDALVHGLFKLPAADSAMGAAQSFLGDELNRGPRDQGSLRGSVENPRAPPPNPRRPGVRRSTGATRRVRTPATSSVHPGFRSTAADVVHPSAQSPARGKREEDVRRGRVGRSKRLGGLPRTPDDLRSRLSAQLLAEFNKELRPLKESLERAGQGVRETLLQATVSWNVLGSLRSEPRRRRFASCITRKRGICSATWKISTRKS